MFKKGEQCHLKNYRPISLSNTDYKIFAFYLSDHLHKVLDKIKSPEQTAYVKTRFIGENVCLLEDIIEYPTKLNMPGLLLFLDVDKSFDS